MHYKSRHLGVIQHPVLKGRPWTRGAARRHAFSLVQSELCADVCDHSLGSPVPLRNSYR